jgi:crotonobetainyl-CoA:carnitine CoA-transferase CaiB-like acyl-CoA transferase
MASITPFGQTGPYRDYKAHELNCSAAGGVLVGVGYPDREPLDLPLSQGSYQAGISAATAIMLALIARKKISQGQFIDISEAEIWADLHVGANVLTFMYRGVTGIRRGTHGGYFLYPNEILPCKDGYIALNCPQLAQWQRFLELMGNPEWAQNPRYRNRRAMHEEYPDEVNALLIPWFKEHTVEELFQLCMERRIPLVPIYRVNELVNHPHLKQRDFFIELDHPQAGRLKYPEGPCRFSETSWQIERPAPLLGEHNEPVLSQRLGYSRQELAELAKEGVI